MLVIQAHVVVIQMALPLECIAGRQRVRELKVLIWPWNVQRQALLQIRVRATYVPNAELVSLVRAECIHSG